MNDDQTIVTKSKYCYLCQGGQTWSEVDGIPDRELTIRSFPSPVKDNPQREINICNNCIDLFKTIAKEVLDEYTTKKSKKK